MTHAAALVGLRMRLARRWLTENGFSLFVMAPLVLGGATAIFQPYVEAAGRATRSLSFVWVPAHAASIAGALVVVLVVSRLSSAIRDVFAIDGDDFYLDALPISPAARLHDVILVRTVKALPLLVGALGIAYFAAPNGATWRSVADSYGPLFGVGTVALAVAEVGAALALVRLRATTAARLAGVGLVAAAMAFATAGSRAPVALAVVIGAYVLALHGFRRWRVEDRDAARETLARAHRTGVRVERLADRLLGPRVGAQVVRDLRLVRRGFSTTPYISFALAFVFPGLAVAAAQRLGLSVASGLRAVECATVLASFALSAITHAIVVYERPRVWMDLTAGVPPSDFPRAKLWLGRILAAPALVLGLLATASLGEPVAAREVLQLAWLTWSTATLASVLCYEIKERPLAGIVLAFLPAAGIPLLTVFYGAGQPMWYFAIFGYVYATSNLAPRAATKVEWDR